MGKELKIKHGGSGIGLEEIHDKYDDILRYDSRTGVLFMLFSELDKIMGWSE